jgi:hypothetical protein
MELKDPKPCALEVLDYLRRVPGQGWADSAEIIRSVGTVCPHKRVSELIGLGLVEKRKKIGRGVEYRARFTS